MSTPAVDPLLTKIEPVAEAALLHEALGKRGAMQHDVKPIYPGAKVVGRALTIRGCPGDNLMLHQAISLARPGDVLVATVDGYLEAGIWGEIATVAAQVRGIRGLVTDGAVRDSEQIARLGFPVFSRGLSIKGTTKRQKGALNQPINVAGVTVHPGDLVVGDGDGVVVVPAAEVDAAIAKAHEIRQREEGIMAKLKAGELTLDLLGLRAPLRELGLEK
ncbi:MAG TPA: 4-carboxy-4-hydroxy-2-oxoadipate aldolase/oxaloacetate decarboxylase [Opitutaceae bacterium]|nr:4-carboxy-4-hydroxy-2-oxoadipate aldolase/oxaloacetate decarboxylase [Opitutaceae bacterium]